MRGLIIGSTTIARYMATAPNLHNYNYTIWLAFCGFARQKIPIHQVRFSWRREFELKKDLPVASLNVPYRRASHWLVVMKVGLRRS